MIRSYNWQSMGFEYKSVRNGVFDTALLQTTSFYFHYRDQDHDHNFAVFFINRP